VSKRRFLIVDDIPLMRMMLKKYLEVIHKKVFGADAAIELVEAGNGAEALRVLGEQESRFDCIFLDLMMPEMDGVGFLQRRRENAQFAGVPVILTTAMDEDGTAQNAMALGANAYIRKPFTIKAVEDTICRVLEVPPGV
jgi:CheY-like chemotaxis protein